MENMRFTELKEVKTGFDWSGRTTLINGITKELTQLSESISALTLQLNRLSPSNGSEYSEKQEAREEVTNQLTALQNSKNHLEKSFTACIAEISNQTEQLLRTKKTLEQNNLVRKILSETLNLNVNWDKTYNDYALETDFSVAVMLIEKMLSRKIVESVRTEIAGVILNSLSNSSSQKNTIYQAIDALLKYITDQKINNNENMQQESLKNTALTFAIDNAFKEYTESTGIRNESNSYIWLIMTAMPVVQVGAIFAFIFQSARENVNNARREEILKYSATFSLNDLFKHLKGGESDFGALKIILIRHILGAYEFAKLASNQNWEPQKIYDVFKKEKVQSYPIISAEPFKPVVEFLRQKLEQGIGVFIGPFNNANQEKHSFLRAERTLLNAEGVSLKISLFIYFLKHSTMQDEASQNYLAVKKLFDLSTITDEKLKENIDGFFKQTPKRIVSSFIYFLIRESLENSCKESETLSAACKAFYDDSSKTKDREICYKKANPLFSKILSDWFNSLKLSQSQKISLQIEKINIEDKLKGLLKNMSRPVICAAVHDLATRIVHPDYFSDMNQKLPGMPENK